MNWQKESIFVTGATGFIGAHVCERLVQAGAGRVRALVHTLQKAPRIGRLPIELCRGSLDSVDSITNAMGDSRIVIHCALGQDYQDIVPHVRTLLRVAESTKIQRFIHLSSTAVYGQRPSPECQFETAPFRHTGDVYSENKMRAEKLILRFIGRGLPAIILRPSIVYGPYSPWDIRVVQGLRDGQLRLIDGGWGICNTTHVDNLVDAILLSLESAKALGEPFFITDGEPVTWGDFVRAHAAMMDPKPKIGEIASGEIEAFWRRQPGFWMRTATETRSFFLGADLRRLLKPIPAFDSVLEIAWRRLRKMDPEKKERLRDRIVGTNGTFSSRISQIPIPDLLTWQIQTGRGQFRIDKARRILGYEPRVSFARGINLVEQWLRFANYL